MSDKQAMEWDDGYIGIMADELTNALDYQRDRTKQEEAIRRTLTQLRDHLTNEADELMSGHLREAHERLIIAWAENDALRAELAAAQAWQPVKDGFEIECEDGNWKLYASEGDIGVVDSRDRGKEYYVYAAPHNLRLCSRAATPLGTAAQEDGDG